MLQEFVQSIKDTVEEQIQDIHTAMPAKIVSIDSDSGLATVLPSIQKFIDGDGDDDDIVLDYPQISDVPIVFPQGAGQDVSISFPVKAGDSCLLIISEQSLEDWLYGRETETDLAFDITNAICIPGLFQTPPETFADACKKDAVIIKAGENELRVGMDGIEVTGSISVKGDLSVSGSFNH